MLKYSKKYLGENFVFFRKWTRKNYGIFNSLGKSIKICTLVLSYILIVIPKSARANSDVLLSDTLLISHEDIEEVVIIGQRTDGIFNEIARHVTLVSSNEIQSSPVQALPDILEGIAGVDIRQRGNYGVQADINIRGGSFDHTLVLFNGINISDPQTGHLSLDVPFDLESIERIEVLNGPGARVFGANAFTGAINIVTQKSTLNNVSSTLSFGDFGFRKLSFNGSIIKGPTQNFLSFSGSSSDGYTSNTDFDIKNIFYQNSTSIGNTNLGVFVGHNQKAFGASGFYSPRFPEQFEKTDLTFAAVKLKTGRKIKLQADVFWRQRHDHFILIRSNPSFYENYHQTNILGNTLNASVTSRAGTTSAGYEIRSENIISNNLGKELLDPVKIPGTDSAYYTKEYSRNNLSFFLEHNISYGKFYVSGGVMLNWNTDYPERVEIFPGVDMSYSLKQNLKFFVSYNRAVHLPTFTDLFYQGPENSGNINLAPDHIQSVETGIKYFSKRIHIQASVYYNKGKNIIDWLWYPETGRYSPVNLTKFSATGFEFASTYRLSDSPKNTFFQHVNVNYTFIHVDKSAEENVSKYYNIKQKIDVGITHRIISDLFAHWSVSFQERTGNYIIYDIVSWNNKEISFQPFCLFDGRIYWEKNYYTLYIESSNILDLDYIDVGSQIQPGRWIKAGIRIHIDSKE
ncbi:MAG: TonB-dependent receptor [Bacteroidales bacterium]|nr:TonB-dependent receptor [Bacteroidales bacterium]